MYVQVYLQVQVRIIPVCSVPVPVPVLVLYKYGRDNAVTFLGVFSGNIVVVSWNCCNTSTVQVQVLYRYVLVRTSTCTIQVGAVDLLNVR